jgi:mono/diheme cytochrome c family protein
MIFLTLFLGFATVLTAGNANAGAKLYRQYCAACHGKNGEGAKGAPGLHAAKRMSDADLLDILKNGRLKRGMPSFSNLPEPQRKQLVQFLKSL